MAEVHAVNGESCWGGGRAHIAWGMGVHTKVVGEGSVLRPWNTCASASPNWAELPNWSSCPSLENRHGENRLKASEIPLKHMVLPSVLHI